MGRVTSPPAPPERCLPRLDAPNCGQTDLHFSLLEFIVLLHWARVSDWKPLF